MFDWIDEVGIFIYLFIYFHDLVPKKELLQSEGINKKRVFGGWCGFMQGRWD